MSAMHHRLLYCGLDGQVVQIAEMPAIAEPGEFPGKTAVKETAFILAEQKIIVIVEYPHARMIFYGVGESFQFRRGKQFVHTFAGIIPGEEFFGILFHSDLVYRLIERVPPPPLELRKSWQRVFTM